jgi:hypothetical protein
MENMVHLSRKDLCFEKLENNRKILAIKAYICLSKSIQLQIQGLIQERNMLL